MRFFYFFSMRKICLTLVDNWGGRVLTSEQLWCKMEICGEKW